MGGKEAHHIDGALSYSYSDYCRLSDCVDRADGVALANYQGIFLPISFRSVSAMSLSGT